MFVERNSNLGDVTCKKVSLSDYEFDVMVDLEDRWMKPQWYSMIRHPSGSHPVWSLNRKGKYILIYDADRYKSVMKDYWKDKENESNTSK